MSDLIVIGYETELKAEEVLLELRKLAKEHLIDLEDAAIAKKDAEGKVKIIQSQNLTESGAVSGALWGLLFGTLFAGPVGGVVSGALLGGAGALAGRMTDIGINDDFIKEIGSTLESGKSALFVLARISAPDKVLDEIKPFGGTILRTSLTRDAEKMLMDALSGGDSASE